jgi:hypothetical protein
MKNSHTENNSFSNNMSTTEKSEQETEEDCSSTATSSNKSNYKYRQKIRKRSVDICYMLNFLERFGHIYITPSISQSFIAKIRKVNFDDNYQELFEKGKNNLGNYFKEDVSTIPDITFWYQRYYYYKRFDEGIQMDYESKIFK